MRERKHINCCCENSKIRNQRTRRADLCLDKKHSKARTKTLLRKNRRHIFTPMFGKIGVQRKMSIFERHPNRKQKREKCQTHHHVIKDVPREMRSERSVQDTQRTSSTQSCSKWKDPAHMPTKQTSVEGMSRQTQPWRAWLYKPKKRRTSSTVVPRYTWSDSRHQLGQTSKSQYTGGWRFSVGKFGAGFSVSVIAVKTMQRVWLLSWVKQWLIVASKTSSPWKSRDKERYHPKKSHQPWVTESWREIWSTPWWKCQELFTERL